MTTTEPEPCGVTRPQTLGYQHCTRDQGLDQGVPHRSQDQEEWEPSLLPALPTGWEAFIVGGFVRDAERARLAGAPPHKAHDVDFMIAGPASFAAMCAGLEASGFKIHKRDEETLTARSQVPAHMTMLRALSKDADFVLARAESSASNGRRPDVVEVGTLETDLARRDFTVNAMARDLATGALIDLHGGLDDLATNTLRFVGDPMERIREDALRILRAWRFAIVKGFTLAPETRAALMSGEAARLLVALKPDGKRAVPVDRVRQEVEQMFRADTLESLRLVTGMPDHTRRAVFSDGLRLSATVRG